MPSEEIGVVEAKRRFSELEQRVSHDESFVIINRGRPTVALVHVYGSLRLTLEQRDQPLAEPDLRIASIALAYELTMVTGNVRHFGRVPGLAVENWLEEP